MSRASLRIVSLLFLITSLAQAQEVRGTVRDSASRQPIAGAVLLLMDSARSVIGRNISNERGEYRIALSGGVRRMRLLRIGFRQREVAIPPAVSGVSQLDVQMVAIPMLLEPVRVQVNAACPRRDDDAAAFALLEQARSGALATLVGHEAKPAALVRYTFERSMLGVSDRPRAMTVRKDSVSRTITSFSAVHSAADFIRRGFMDDAADGQTFFAPDAEVLLDDGFASGYCFRVMPPDRGRPNQVGLGFQAANRKRGRVEVDGALWIDTAARALHDMEFRYLGLDSRIERYRPGGTISFREMPNGVVLIDRWMLRLIGGVVDSVSAIRPDRSGISRLRPQPAAQNERIQFYVNESGGEVAHARWPDSAAWAGSLGTLHARALTGDRRPVKGVGMWLPGTPYRAVSDSSGRVTIHDLVPGPYTAVVIDSTLLPIDLAIPTTVRFIAARDSTVEQSFQARTAEEYVVERCMAEHRYTFSPGDSTRVIARIVYNGGEPANDVRWQARVNTDPSPDPSHVAGAWVSVREGGRTGTDGLLQLCTPLLTPNATIEIQAWRKGATATVQRRLSGRLTVIQLPLESRP